MDSRPNNLPSQPTRFLGRQKELAAVLEMLGRADVRLLTLTGAGGSGKTRLAMQAAAALADGFEHGAFFVDLAPLTEPAQVPAAVLSALRVPEFSSDRSALEVLKNHLRGMELLAVLDNFEHLLPAARSVSDLLEGCPRLKVLATSREPLHVRREQEMAVDTFETDSLAAAESEEALMRHDAVRLFVERARAIKPDFGLTAATAPVVARICGRLDGLPLAIELAAASIKSLPPAALLARLEDGVTILHARARDVPTRQRTLEATIEWSYGLLEERERRLFRGLSVFAGGWTLEAMDAACADAGSDAADTLHSLVDKSLVRQRDDGGKPRFQMLQTVREYALRKLDLAGEAEGIRQRCIGYFVDLAEHAEPMLYTGQQAAWFKRLDDEYGNLAAALSWLRDNGPRQLGMRLAGALGWYWFRRARYAEGIPWLSEFRTGGEEYPKEQARLAYHTASLRASGFDIIGEGPAFEAMTESLRLYRTIGSKAGVALCLAGLLKETEEVEFTREGEVVRPTTETFRRWEESVALAREAGNPWVLSRCLMETRPQSDSVEDVQRARAEHEESIALARGTGDPYVLCQAHFSVAKFRFHHDDVEAAESSIRESISIARQADDKISILMGLYGLGMAQFSRRQLPRAKRFLQEALQLGVELGAKGALHYMIGAFDHLARREGKPRRAARFWAAAVVQMESDIPAASLVPQMCTLLGLDEETARAECEAGFAMTLEQVVAYALSDE